MEEVKDNVRISNEGKPVTEASEDEKNEAVKIGLKKFSSPDALYDSYVKLEAEFTRRSQELKKLKRLLSERENPPETPEGEKAEIPEEKVEPKDASSSAEGEKENPSDKREVTDEEKEEIIREYLENLTGGRVPVMRGGGYGLSVKKHKPQTIREAGGLALQYFKKD